MKKRQSMCACGAMATRQCQASNSGTMSHAHKLCGKALCDNCAIQVNNILYCGEHAQQPDLFCVGVGEKKPKTSRLALDAYYTRRWMIAALMLKCPELLWGGVLFDPCCGDRRMVEMLKEYFETIITNDINKQVTADFHEDATNEELWRRARTIADTRPLIVITNPPFNKAGAIARHCRAHAKSTSLLLRCTWGEPCGGQGRNKASGRSWLVDDPPTGLIMMSRDSFRGNKKTDLAPAWWFIWEETINRIMVYAKPGAQKETIL